MQTRTRPAFTLIEVMVSLFLVLICLASFQAHATLQIRHVASSRRESAAALLAQSRAEYTHSIPCPSDTTTNTAPPSAGIDSAEGATLTWSTQTTPDINHVEMRSRYTGLHAIRSALFSTSGRCR